VGEDEQTLDQLELALASHCYGSLVLMKLI